MMPYKNFHRHLGIAVRVGAAIIILSILWWGLCPQCFLYWTGSTPAPTQQQQ